MSGTIDVDKEGKVCTITLKNEGKRNAISYPMMAEVIETMESLEEADDDYVVVFRGAGEHAFSAGFDLSQDRDEEKQSRWPRMNDLVDGYEYPTIAMLNGDTYGGAIELAASCDIRLGRLDSTFGITPAKIGIVYGPRAIQRVMNLIGPAKTKELLFTANSIDAEHAEEIGFLNYLLEDDEELESRTDSMAETIAGNAPLSLKGMNAIIDAILEKRAMTDAEVEWGQQIRKEAFESRDHEEGVEAFNEGREPEFEGR